MFNVGAVVESMRRHWIAIVVIFALALGAGAASSFLKTGSEAQEISDKAYTAEASVYVTLEAVDGSMISEASDRLISDARRTVISDKVAGEIRRIYGNEVSVYSPWWLDEEKNARYYSHYIFVDVSAPTQEIALAATNDAAKLAAEVMATTLPVKSVAVAEEAYLKQGDGSQAADRGVDALEEIESAAVTSSAISVKKLVIFGFVGLFGAIFVFACVDILSRRIRSARDVERMLDLPVLGVIKGEEDYAGALAAADVLLNPTYSDNYPTVNLEALCCGTPVLTYRTGGSPEPIREGWGAVADQGNLEQVLELLPQTCAMKPDPAEAHALFCKERAIEAYSKLYFG